MARTRKSTRLTVRDCIVLAPAAFGAFELAKIAGQWAALGVRTVKSHRK